MSFNNTILNQDLCSRFLLFDVDVKGILNHIINLIYFATIQYSIVLRLLHSVSLYRVSGLKTKDMKNMIFLSCDKYSLIVSLLRDTTDEIPIKKIYFRMDFFFFWIAQRN